MTATTIPERFFKDEDIRVLHIDGNTTYIKRVYAEEEILYECSHREVITTLDNTNAVHEWIGGVLKEQRQKSTHHTENEKTNPLSW